MAKEGLDIPRLDTLFLATPRAEVLQAVGRILRPHPDKEPPVVIDLVDEALGLPAGLARKRRRAYERLGWIEKRPREARRSSDGARHEPPEEPPDSPGPQPGLHEESD